MSAAADLTPADVSERVGVSVKTVHRWIDSGALAATNLSAGQAQPRWRIAPDDLAAFLRGRRQGPGDAA